MFGKKKIVIPGRQRPNNSSDRPNAAVFSYHTASRNAARPAAGNVGRDVYAQQRSAGAAAERRASSHRGLGKWPLVAIAVVFVALLVNSLFVGTTPRLERVGDARAAIFLRSPQTYEQAAAALMGKSLTNRTKLTIDTAGIASKMAQQYPELGTVTLLLPVVGYQPVLRVEPAAPALILTSAGGQSYVLDAIGRALITPSQAPNVSKLGLPVVTDQSGLPLQLGKQALPSTTTHFITEVTGQLQAVKLTIASLTLPKGTSELDVRLVGQPYFVKYNLMGNAREEAGSFLAVKQQLERDHKTPGQYIDVRVEGRAYYK
jgi:hypothetical protein